MDPLNSDAVPQGSTCFRRSTCDCGSISTRPGPGLLVAVEVGCPEPLFPGEAAVTTGLGDTLPVGDPDFGGTGPTAHCALEPAADWPPPPTPVPNATAPAATPSTATALNAPVTTRVRTT